MMAHDELIEAMARAMMSANVPWDIPSPQAFYPAATAALNALRDTLEPVAWEYAHAGMECRNVRRSRDRDPDYLQSLGWTETPLYALPEVNKHGA
jgi:hypothetical protein